MPRKKKEEEKEERSKEEGKEEKEEIGKSEEKETEKKKEGKEELLVPLEDYIKAAVHLGTRAVTPGMREYVYRRKADGIAVLNTKKIDEKIALAANLLTRYTPEKIVVCCKRDAGHNALEAFGSAIGAKIFKKYPPGMITNPDLDTFFEPEIVLVVDPWLDKNVIRDSAKVHIPIIALCDTNNVTDYIDLVIPCNNKTAKSIGLILYILAKLYLEKKGIKRRLDAKDFYELEEEPVSGKEKESAIEIISKVKKAREEKE
ncbi:MAG: 30S ribosomal protein S2 [Candidatus Pacearchaeota archaeon]|nr:30S ribosomal protein S2 [Candidatus Pacearchaeota archaeon]